VVSEAGEMAGKEVGDSPKGHVFFSAARTSGHDVVYCLKVARADIGKQRSPDIVVL
jgi:hypothetical protein